MNREPTHFWLILAVRKHILNLGSQETRVAQTALYLSIQSTVWNFASAPAVDVAMVQTLTSGTQVDPCEISLSLVGFLVLQQEGNDDPHKLAVPPEAGARFPLLGFLPT
mmetsp:Transcript_48031/g.112194  ORF Transcript_48031/g.112194 Transcript_48031/m.112194 type:complete len:109 (-) Transcript_48031:1359-1685(-)